MRTGRELGVTDVVKAKLVIDQRKARQTVLALHIGAVMLAALALWILIAAISVAQVETVTGVVRSLRGRYVQGAGRSAHVVERTEAECGDDDRCGPYAGSALALANNGTDYRVDPPSFRPVLGRWFVAEGTTVRLWYTQGPLLETRVVALRVLDVSSQQTLHITGGYTDSRREPLLLAGIGVSLAAAIAACEFLARNLFALTSRHGWLIDWLGLYRFPPDRHHKRRRR